jgi:hypothetical protein
VDTVSNERGRQKSGGVQPEETRIVRIEIVPAVEEDRQEFLLTNVKGNRRQKLLEGLRDLDAAPSSRDNPKFAPERAVEPLLKSLETAQQLVVCMRRHEASNNSAQRESLRSGLVKCVLTVTDLRNVLADYLAELRERDDPTAA